MSGNEHHRITYRQGAATGIVSRMLVLLTALASIQAMAATRYYTLAGSTAEDENACPAWAFAEHGDDCSWNNSRRLDTGYAQWIGPVYSAGYYAPGAAPAIFTNPAVPAPVTAPAPVLPAGGKNGIAIRSAFLAIEDQNTPDGSDDYVSGTIEFDGFERNVATGASTRIVESFGKIIHRLAWARVSSAMANAGGGLDYVVALFGDDAAAYPTLPSGDSGPFPSRVASQSSADASDIPYWTTPPGSLGIAALEGSDYLKGTTSTATVWGYACGDAGGGPAAGDCNNSPLTWSSDRSAGFGNILLKIATDSSGSITTAEALLVRETKSTATADNADTWVATRLNFTGVRTESPAAFDDRSILVLPRDPGSTLGGVSIDVLANDLSGITPATVSIDSGPAQGSASIVANRIQYQRNGAPAGTQEIVYRITDADGQSATATAQVVLTNPLLCVDDEQDGSPDTPATVNVLVNDSGFDQPPVTLSVSGQPAQGEAIVNPDRTITFTPPAGRGGAYVTRYRLADGSGQSASCSLTITLPATPQAVDDSAAVLQNNNVLVDVLANDVEASDTPLTLNVTQSPAHGSTSIDTTGTRPHIRYTPVSGYAGDDSFQYTVTDKDGDVSNAATVTISVFGPPENDLPRCANDEFDGQRNTERSLDVLANDTGLNALPLTLSVLAVYPAGMATAEVNPDNTIQFTPGTDKGGHFMVTYSVREVINSAVICSATIRINDVPVAVSDRYDAINFGRDQPLGVLSNDQGLTDEPLALEIISPPAHGSLRICAAVAEECPGYTAGARPFFIYRFNDASGSPGSDQFAYRITDGDGDTSNDATARITLKSELEASNDPGGFDPVLAGTYPPAAFQSTGYTAASGHGVTLDLLANDAGFRNGPISLTIETPPTQGKLVVNASNSVTYTAPDGYIGLVQFRYRITDSLGQSDTADVGLYVFPGPNNKSGGSALDLPVLLMLLTGLLIRMRRYASQS